MIHQSAIIHPGAQLAIAHESPLGHHVGIEWPDENQDPVVSLFQELEDANEGFPLA